jgi:hypothetical protein
LRLRRSRFAQSTSRLPLFEELKSGFAAIINPPRLYFFLCASA